MHNVAGGWEANRDPTLCPRVGGLPLFLPIAGPPTARPQAHCPVQGRDLGVHTRVCVGMKEDGVPLCPPNALRGIVDGGPGPGSG